MPSVIQADLLKDVSANKTLATLSSSAVTLHSDVTFPAGHIIQVQFRGFDGVQTIGNGSSTGKTFVNIGTGVSGEEFSIDMAVSSGNKIIGFGAVNLSANARYSALKIFMDSDQIAKGTADGNRTEVTVASQRNSSATNDSILMHNSAFQFHYTPSDTSLHTYKVQAGNTWDNSYYTFINRQPDDTDQNFYNHRGYSHFMLMEVAQ